jgi:aspartyl-tRNA(Asn)/glutamyl-tRNA(Gln) amidotransferase subunit C
MNIDTEMVDYIAELSRLELQAGEKQAMTAELDRIIAYMDVLNRLDTQGVEPMSHVFPVKNVLREDTVAASQDRDELLAGSPAGDKEAFLVPKAVE